MADEPRSVSAESVQEAVSEITRELRAAAQTAVQRVDCTPESIEKDLARLVLTLVDLIRQLLERQAIRRMEGGSLDNDQVEQMGQALMKLEAKVHDLAAQFGLRPEELNLQLGPLGSLLPETRSPAGGADAKENIPEGEP